MHDCIFCKVVRGEIPSTKIYEDDKILAFKDISPEAPVHILIIPKNHINSLNDITAETSELIGYIFLKAKDIARDHGIADSGYRIVTNCGKQGGQTVEHIHYHLLGGRNLTWPPG